MPQIRRAILGCECKDHLIVVDEAWTGRPIDAQAGDIILLPPAVTLEGSVVETVHRERIDTWSRASNPGVGRALLPDAGWAQYLRVSRKQFAGLARFRHLEEAEDE